MSTAYQDASPGSRRVPTLSKAQYDQYLPMVRRIAMRLARRVPAHISVSDLVSSGWVGLLEALARANGVVSDEEFEGYASHRVKGAMLDHVRSIDPSARAARNASRRVARTITALGRTLGRPPHEEEIAAALGLTEVAYQATLADLAKAGMARLEILDIDDVDSADPNLGPDDEADRREISDAVAEAIGTLPERLRTLLGLYYQEECTFREIGAILGVTESRACQLHTESMHRLRAAIGKELVSMSDGIYAALSGAVAQSQALEVTAGNLANASTAGYRGSKLVFREVMAQQAGNMTPVRATKVAATVLDTTAGDVHTTGRGLDFVLPPDTFLAVSTDRGERYTRAGSLTLGTDGKLKAGGQDVLNESGKPIAYDPRAQATISPDGQIIVDGDSVAHLRLVQFERPEALTHDNGVVLAADAAGQPRIAKDLTLQVGALEGSNASPMSGMTELMTSNRSFEAFKNAMDAFRDADRRVITLASGG